MTQPTDKKKQPGSILIVDDDEDVLLAASMLLKRHFAHVERLQDPRRLMSMCTNKGFDVVLLDMNFEADTTSGKEGFFWLRQLQEVCPDTVVVVITAYGDVEMAVKAVREGAYDFVLKPWQNEKLLSTIGAAMRMKESKQEVRELKGQVQALNEASYHDFIGNSPGMRNVFDHIRKVAPTDANVLITGENGTGKELVARALHRQSNRSDKVFVSVDMGAIPESLFESELFGHTKGAFTDAKEDRKGRFELASGGTLFLDEIGNLPLPLQAKLLAVLQNRTITPLGSSKTISIDIRLVCATNLNLLEMVQKGEFRQDLLYRMNTVEVHLPPLRERGQDILLLAHHYLQKYERKYGKEFGRLTAEQEQALMSYPWPGNVRELQHTLERAIILSDAGHLNIQEHLKPAGAMSGTPNEPALKQPVNLQELEEQAVRKALERHGGNISRAAKELGLSRMALYRRMEKYGI